MNVPLLLLLGAREHPLVYRFNCREMIELSQPLILITPFVVRIVPWLLLRRGYRPPLSLISNVDPVRGVMFRIAGAYTPAPFVVCIRPHVRPIFPFIPSPVVACSRSIHSC